MAVTVTRTFLGMRQLQNGPYMLSAKLALTGLALPTTAWVANAVHAVGDQITDGTNIEICVSTTADSKSGATAPAWPTLGNTVIDNHVTWRNIGVAVAVPHGLTNGNGVALVGRTPIKVVIEDTAPNSAAGLYESQPADSTYLYVGIAGSISNGNFYVEWA